MTNVFKQDDDTITVRIICETGAADMMVTKSMGF